MLLGATKAMARRLLKRALVPTGESTRPPVPQEATAYGEAAVQFALGTPAMKHTGFAVEHGAGPAIVVTTLFAMSILRSTLTLYSVT